MDLKRVASIDQKYIDIVFGFINHAQLLFPTNNPYYTIADLIKHLCLLYFYNNINSTILTNEEESQFLFLLKKQGSLDHLDNYSWNLLYRKTDDGFSFDTIRKKAHGLKDVIVLIHTDSNNVFGGYLSVGWNIEIPSGYPTVKDKKSFLFLIRSSKSYPMGIIRISNAICASYTRSHHVCIFGGGYDICIGDNSSGSNRRSYTNVHYYKRPNGKGYYYLNGDVSNFNAIQIEIYQLQKLEVSVS